MAINPNIIINGIRPVKFQSPDLASEYRESAALKGLMAQQEMQGMQLETARRGVADEEAVRAAYSQAGGDNARLRAILGERGQYKAIQGLDKHDLEVREKNSTIDKNKAQGDKARIDAELQQVQHGSAILSTAKDQPTWDAARRVFSLQFPNLAGQLPEQYDPQFVEAKIAAGQTLAQRLADKRKQEDQAQTAATAPFTPGPNGPVPNVPVQDFQLRKSKAGAPNVSVKTDVKTGESLAGQVGPMMKDSTATAEGAVRQVDAARRIVQAIDSGNIITGPTADARLAVSQVAQVLGIGGKDDAEKIANTRQALRGLAELTLQGRQQMRGQGAITESEGKLAEKAMSGEISLTASEIRQLAKASERAARFNYAEHQRKLKVMQDNPGLSGVAPFYQGPNMPDAIPDAAPAAPVSDTRQKADLIIGTPRGNR